MVNLFDFGFKLLPFHNWKLGDMVYFKVFGHGFLILGSLERVYDIFERRSSNYSDRPRLVMLNELSVNFHCRMFIVG
jgi:hypothetical protein